VRIYRATHHIITLAEFHGYDMTTGQVRTPTSIKDPRNYLIFYLGEFDPEGRLLRTDDELLYWMIPIFQRRNLPASKEEYERNGGFPHYYIDYVAKHAGCDRPVKE
jgi:hypothetical protein